MNDYDDYDYIENGDYYDCDDVEDYYDWEDYESEFWRGYTHAKLLDMLDGVTHPEPSLWYRFKSWCKNLYYRWKHPMDDIPF